MRYKESAIAVMVAVMLGAASLLGGLTAPVLATHDPDATQVTTKQFAKEDDEVTNIEAIEFNAKKSTLRASGTITVEILQNGDAIDSATLSTSEITTTYTTQEVDFGIEVEGSFDVLVEYVGSGLVQVSAIEVLEGTQTAGEEETSNGQEGASSHEPEQLTDEEENNIVTTKTIALEDDESLDVQTVEFIAKKSTLRASGTITVAIVQDGEVLAEDSMSTNGLSTTYSDLVADLGIEVIGAFQVVIMYEGSGLLSANSIVVPGAPTPAPNPDPEPDPVPNPDGTFDLTINAVDGDGNAVNGMWIEVYEGMVPDGDPEFTGETATTFPLEAGDYVVAVADFGTNIFQEWSDGETSRARVVQLQQDTSLTAIYSTDGTEPAGEPDPNPDPDPVPDPSPPPTGGSGSIAVFAYRIPSEFWGPTFTGANAQMWITIHNSTGYAIFGHGTDEDGYTFTGLNDGEQYWVLAHDCVECHGDTHTVAFDHWGDGSTEMARLESTGVTLSAYYEFQPGTQ